jgi:hypothetical protein
VSAGTPIEVVIDGTCVRGIPHSGEATSVGIEGTRVEFWIPDAPAPADESKDEEAA